MEISLPPQLEAALNEQAERRGLAPNVLAVAVLQERLLPKIPSVEARDEWERKLFGAAIDCGVSVPDKTLSSDGLYE